MQTSASKISINPFNNLRVGYKLFLGVVLMVLVCAVIAGTGQKGMNRLNAEVHSMYEDRLMPVSEFVGLKADLMEARGLLVAMIHEPVQEKQKQSAEKIQQITHRVDETLEKNLQKKEVSAERLGKLRDFQNVWMEFKDTRDNKIIPSIYQGAVNDALALATGIQAERFKQMTGFANDLIEDVKREALTGKNQVEQTALNLRNILWSVSIAGVAICSLLNFLIARSISKPLAEVVFVARAIAGGQLGKRLRISSKDEIGHMSQNLNHALEAMSSAIQSAGQSSSALSNSSEELTSVSQQMSGTAEETAAQAGTVSASAQQITQNVEMVSSGVEEMRVSIQEIARNASEAAQIVSKAVQTAKDANAKVVKLGDSSTEIGNIIKVITSIAEQTNLLALNATIEAARAGEAGKGFAVVANEVKELAKQTAKATEDISQKIGTVQTDTQGVLEAINQINAVINKVNDISSSIASAVEQQTSATNEICQNLAEVARGSSDISKNIDGVAQGAKMTTEGTVSTRSAAEELAKIAATLEQQMSQFKFS